MFKCFFHLLFAFAALSVSAQSSPEGKKYMLLLSSDCAKMEGGGCTFDTYKVWEFTKNKLFIYEQVKASCTTKELEKRHANKSDEKKWERYWTIKNNKIFVEKYDEYGKMELKGDKIIATKGTKITEFTEEK